MELHDSFSKLRAVITVQVCHEHKKIDHGLLDYGMGYNGTILDGSVVTFRCYTGLPKACNYLLITKMIAGYESQGPEKKTCDAEDDWIPDQKVVCEKSGCNQCYVSYICLLLSLGLKF